MREYPLHTPNHYHCCWKIQLDERRALPQYPLKALSPIIPYARSLPQHPRQAPSPFSPYAIASKIQRGQRRALAQDSCQAPSTFSLFYRPYVIASKI